MNGQIKEYQTTDTLGKSQIELVVQVYDGAISSYKQAIESYSREEFQDGFEQLERGKKFMTHLYTTLDLDKGGEVAASLGKLYAFVINQTQMAESTKDISLLESNIEILDNLRSGWQEINTESTAVESMTGHQSGYTETTSNLAGLVVSG